jgi:hypothetical protein
MTGSRSTRPKLQLLRQIHITTVTTGTRSVRPKLQLLRDLHTTNRTPTIYLFLGDLDSIYYIKSKYLYWNICSDLLSKHTRFTYDL